MRLALTCRAILGLLALTSVAWGADDPRGLKVVYGEGRTALVIGNSAYASSPLRNPANDARGVADLLRQRKFDVTEVTNGDKQKMEAAIDAFGRALKAGGVGLFYYAGHAMQINGENYLIPVGARIDKEGDVKYQAVNVGQVLIELEGSGNRLNIVILDSCRDNPFARSFRSAGAGLARMDAPSGTLIAYATAPGKTAADGEGENGVYTAALLREMDTPGQELSELFKKVRASVETTTARKQTPWESTSVKGNFYFTPIDVLDQKLNLTAEQLARYKLLIKEQQDADARLNKMETEKNAAIADMNRQIEELRKKANQTGTADGTLDQIVALGEKRKQAKADMETAQRRADDERRLREAEIVVLKEKERANRKAAFDTRYAKYQSAVVLAAEGNLTAAELTNAWKTICREWRVADAGDDPGDLLWNDADEVVQLASVGGVRFGRGGHPVTVDLGGSLDMELVWIPPGSFLMGSPDSDTTRSSAERAQHRVTISRGFWMGKYEVTQVQWARVMGSNPSGFVNAGKEAPVETVSWNDCQMFIQRLNTIVANREFRLPTEAEWEYASRAGTKARFCTGNTDSDLDRAGWYGENSGRTTHPAGQKEPNAWGLYDMHGNVWEWCQDWKGDYPASNVTDPAGPSSGTDRVLRGGSWGEEATSCCSAARRCHVPGNAINYDGGLRVVASR